MLHVVSKIGKVNRTDEQIYTTLSDFNNLGRMLPPDKVQVWEATEDTCSFTIEKAGKISLRMIEKQPYKTIKVGSGEGVPMEFMLWIQLKQIDPYKTAIRITVKADANMMMRTMLKKPLQKGLDSMIDNLEKM